MAPWYLTIAAAGAAVAGVAALAPVADPTRAAPASPSGPPVAGLVPSFAEEFDGTEVDKRRWIFAFYDPRTERPTAAKRSIYGNAEAQLYMDRSYMGLGIDPFRVAGGTLTIEARPFTPPELAKVRADIAREPAAIRDSALKKVAYSSGVISTRGRFAQRYGYFEMRARWSSGKGLWPVFWLLPQSGRWPPEIDVVEAHGDKPGVTYQSLHSTRHPPITREARTQGPQSEFRRYGVLWTPGRLDYYTDGIKTASIPASADLTEPMYLLANLGVGGNWPGYPDAATKFPATMEIDYIRAWRFEAAPTD